MLAVIGTVSIAGTVIDRINSSVKQQSSIENEQLEKFLAPIIMYDPDTFDDISLANTQQLISIAIWSVLDSNPEPDKYEYTDGGMLMPQKEVEDEFVSLFGNEITLTHSTVDGGEGVTFKYSNFSA